MIEIIFLGTGTSQGIPGIGSTRPVCQSQNPKDKRLRASLAIKWNRFFFVIDCGPDFRQQMLNCGAKKLDGILYTHEHADQTTGIFEMRPFYWKNKKKIMRAIEYIDQYQDGLCLIKKPNSGMKTN